MSGQSSDPVFSTPLNVSVNMVNGTNIIQVNSCCKVYCPFFNMQSFSSIVMDKNAENVDVGIFIVLVCILCGISSLVRSMLNEADTHYICWRGRK